MNPHFLDRMCDVALLLLLAAVGYMALLAFTQ